MAKRVLIVEDELALREAWGDLLASEGYAVEAAAHGREALQRLESSDSLPDVILLDLMMPVMSGREFLEKRAASPRLRQVPVIVCGADLRDLPLKLRPEACLQKPVTFATLLEALGRMPVNPGGAATAARRGSPSGQPAAGKLEQAI
jgi:CheY-like chemotaxis protein